VRSCTADPSVPHQEAVTNSNRSICLRPLKLSIALPSYNRADFLAEQFESLLRQSRLPDELIVGDDCSTDRTVEVIRTFAARAPFPVHWYVNKRNQGYNRNLEHAIGLCSGDVIVLCDDDDVCLPHKLRVTEREFLGLPSTGLMVSNSALVDERLNSLGVTLWDTARMPAQKVLLGEPICTLAKHFVGNGHVVSFRAALRPYILPFPLRFPSHIFCDIWISLVLASVASVVCIPEPLVLHRLHSNQIAGVQTLGPSGERVRNIRCSERERIAHFVPLLEEVIGRVADRSNSSIARRNLKALTSWTAHLRMQSELPVLRTSRVLRIASALLAGSYHRYSRGFLTAARDLLILA
jgi:glycosyltransferase involved in cell wall biosynthesis